jgi:hypothetical protein
LGKLNPDGESVPGKCRDRNGLRQTSAGESPERTAGIIVKVRLSGPNEHVASRTPVLNLRFAQANRFDDCPGVWVIAYVARPMK